MSKNFKVILSCVGLTAVMFLLVNVLHAFYDLTQINLSDLQSVRFKHGAFFFNDQSTGLMLGSSQSRGALIVLFTALLIYNFRNGKLTFTKKN